MARLLAEKFSSWSGPCVRKEMAQWKKFFHNSCSNGLQNFSLMVCEKDLSARRNTLMDENRPVLMGVH